MSMRLSRSRLIILIALLFSSCAFVRSAEAAPIAPVLNTATAGNARVDLSWGAVGGATGYNVKYDTVSGGSVAPKNFTTDADCVGAWKLNETSGTVTDSCKTNHGTVTGTLTRGVIGQYNSAIEFLGPTSGNNAIVNFGSATVLDNLRPRTLVAWIKPDTLGEGNAGTIFDKNYQDGWVLRLAANNNVAFSQAFGGGVVTWTTMTNAVVMGTWQHVAVAYNGTGLNDVPIIYINGVAQATVRAGTPYGTMDNDAAYNLGFGIKGGVQEFDGRIDEAAIFKRVLTQAEITGIMNNRLDGGVGKIYLNQTDVGNVTNYMVTGLTNGTTYYFTVAAKDATGEGANSNEQSATPALPSESATLFVKNVDYNAAGQMTKVEYGNGDVTTYTYNELNLRLTRLYTVDKNGVALQDLNYKYDSVGNILSITDNVNTADQTFQYDELNRLKQATGNYANNGTTQVTKTYVYDTIGNIVEKDNKTYFYGGTSGGPHAVTSLSDGTTFSYDANGNMITKVEAGVTTAYTYDAENRLIKVVKNGSTIGQYEYDGDGGRTKKTATVAGTTTTTTFVGSLFETSGSRSTRFIFLGDQRIAAVTNSPAIGSTTLYYHADHLGGANVLTDATGFKKELIEYEPFGLESRHEKYGSSEEVAWYYFTGKKTDDESGLIYFGARYYDPKLGRFISPDTIVPYPGDPQSFNRYSYARNNPVNVIDPTGHKWSWKKFWHAAVGALVGVAAAIVLGPAGLGLGLTMAGIIGGAAGGAVTGGLEGGWKGALMGAAFGGALGGVGGWAVAGGHSFVLGGMFLAGVGVAAATDSWDSFAGGLAGSAVGWGIGKGITSAYRQQFANYRAGYGWKSNAAASKAGYNTKEWIGYNEDQYQTLKSDRPNILKAYQNDPNVEFVRDPSFDQFQQALRNGSRAELLHTHGGPSGLEFSDGIHSLQELGGIAQSINVKTVGVSSCYPRVQIGDWNSLNVTQTRYLDLSATGHFVGDPEASDRLMGIQNVYKAYQNN